MKKRRYFHRLTPITFYQTIFPTSYYRWEYLGYTFNIFDEGTEGAKIIDDFFKFVDSKARPWWCPKTILRILHLIGNDSSIARVRWWWAHNLHRTIMKGILITDVKTKFSELRIYGYFSDEIEEEVRRLEDLVHPLIKKQYK
jgi:hypothetical protein